MAKIQAPIKSLVDLKSGAGITEPWREYFARIDEQVNSAKFNSITLTVSTALGKNHLGNYIKVNNAASLVTITLPSVGATEVDSWIGLIRLGSGPLKIKAPDSDTIESSSAGGFIRCDEGPERVLANVKLYLATATQWAILAGTGIWKVF